MTGVSIQYFKRAFMAMNLCMGFNARLLIGCLCLSCMSSFSQIQVLERVVAIVDKDVVLQSELDQRISASSCSKRVYV